MLEAQEAGGRVVDRVSTPPDRGVLEGYVDAGFTKQVGVQAATATRASRSATHPWDSRMDPAAES